MRKAFSACILLLFVMLSFTACGSDKGKDNPATINHGIIQVKEFEVSTGPEDSNTEAKGHVYVRKNEDNISIAVVASLVIGEQDWGGVAFYIPAGWNIVNVLSSYPGGNSNSGGNDNGAAIQLDLDSE